MEKITKKYVLNNLSQIGSLVCESMCFNKHIELPDATRKYVCSNCPLRELYDDIISDISIHPFSEVNDVSDFSLYFDLFDDICFLNDSII